MTRARRIALGGLLAACLLSSAGNAQPGRSLTAEPETKFPGRLCSDAVQDAERHYRLPPGLLFAISQVESGRPDPATHQSQPWPWTVQANDQGLFFDSKKQAVQWVADAMARGVTSIDTGCMQVNLFFHPHAFVTLEDAFDPNHNADYAARFLLQLRASVGDWRQAVGFYHSQTAALAAPYEARVSQMLGSSAAITWAAQPKPASILSKLGDAWRATVESQAPAPESRVGRNWSAFVHTSNHPLTKRLPSNQFSQVPSVPR